MEKRIGRFKYVQRKFGLNTRPYNFMLNSSRALQIISEKRNSRVEEKR